MPKPTNDELVAWMRATKGGYKAASKHFGCEASDLREMVADSRARAREAKQSAARARKQKNPAAPKPKPSAVVHDEETADEPDDWAALTPIEFRRKLINASMTRAADERNGAAAAALIRQATIARAELDELEAGQPSAVALTDEERIRLCEQWPDRWLEDCARIMTSRYESARLKLITDDYETELGAGGWLPVLVRETG